MRSHSVILNSVSNHLLVFLKNKALQQVTVMIVFTSQEHNLIISLPDSDSHHTAQVSLPRANVVLVVGVRRLGPHLHIVGIDEDVGADPLTRDPASRDWEVEIDFHDDDKVDVCDLATVGTAIKNQGNVADNVNMYLCNDFYSNFYSLFIAFY